MMLKSGAVAQAALPGQFVCRGHSIGIDVEPGDSAAGHACHVESILTRAETDLECVRTGSDLQKAGNRVCFFCANPARLAEVAVVVNQANLPIHVQIMTAVGMIIEIEFLRRPFSKCYAIRSVPDTV